ncbi:sensor histidine kinase [Desulfosporosinus burensis]
MKLSKTLWLLAVFGFTHAMSEWGYLFVPIQTAGREEYLLILLMVHLAFMALSFAFLLAFGLAQYYEKKIYLLVPTAIFVVWYVNFIFYFDKQTLAIWHVNSEIWARYLLGFPGAILSGLGLWRRRQELMVWGVKISHNLRNASITLLIYSVLGGLIVPAGDVFPSRILNNQNFLLMFHIPVQVVRAVSSMFLSWYVLRILSVFRLEYEKNIEKMEKLETLCSERQRIANDIHDGAIQAIYGSGMLLDRASELIDKDPVRSKELISKVIERYNETIKSLRRYIHGLKSDDYGQAAVEQRFNQMFNEYREGFPNIKFEASLNIPIWFIFIPNAVDHTFFIMQEALANAARHSGGSSIFVEICGDELLFSMTIKDNGRGIGFVRNNCNQLSSVSGLHGHGIDSMHQRSKHLHSRLEITYDQGTQVMLQVERSCHSVETF